MAEAIGDNAIDKKRSWRLTIAVNGRRTLRQEFRDSSGRLYGWRHQTGNRATGYAVGGRMVGWYDARSNETRRWNGVLFARGDALAALICENGSR